VVTASGQRVGPASVDCLELDAIGLAPTALAPPGPPATLDDAVYGFYTSGSTGTPKCAINIHRGLLNRFTYMTRTLSDRTDEVVLQNSRPQFDSSLWQLLWPLTTGSTVVIPERSGILDLPATIETIRRYGVTMTDFVPSIFNTLVELLHVEPELVGRLSSLRRLLIGGEEMTPRTVHAFRALMPGVATINTYGPTEASIGSVFHHVADVDGDDIPIGRPIDNTYVVIVDENLDPVRPGELGELCIGGACLGLGYLGDPAKTRAAFVPNPFPEIPGTQLYRTGDLGYHGPDGLIYFVGRRDQQVKISGVRIELSEVEAALLRLPDVIDAKVVVAGDREARSLIGFVTARSPSVDAATLAAGARDLLPATMLPRRIEVISAMPLTPNGKVDRRALTAIAESWSAPATHTAASTDVASVVRTAWLELLPVAEIAPGDDFFDLGGDSLSAQRLAIALAGRLGRRVTARDIFELSTLGEQIEFIDGSRARRAPTAPAFQPDTVLPPDIPAVLRPQPVALADVLLTGATGFIGAQLLHDLLTSTRATIHCLVRSPDAGSAARRVVDNLCRYRLWRDEFAARIIAVPGDLSQPMLGLGGDGFGRLADRVDTILHSGAMVNLARSYRAHYKTNVAGTCEIIRLATTGRPKPIHFMSTLGTIAASPGDPTTSLERSAANEPPTDGYSQSKWVAERLLEGAADRGLPVTIYRVGEVMPHSIHGVPSRDGLADLLVKACVRTGFWFRSPIVMDYTQVECVSGVVIAAMIRGESGYLHPVQPGLISLNDLLAAFRDEFRLVEVGYHAFRESVAATVSEHPEQRDLSRLLAVLPPATESDSGAITESLTSLFRDSAAGRTGERADALIADAGLPWTPVGPDVFERYAGYYRSPYGVAALRS
jgi:amino acid adenylation domain-containing protein/thioester reductase-like protein